MKSFTFSSLLTVYVLFSILKIEAQLVQNTEPSDQPVIINQEQRGRAEYKEPHFNSQMFLNTAITDLERDDYATNLTLYAVSRIHSGEGDQASFDLARRLIALALNLSPRNRKGVVVNAQLKKGVLPELGAGGYDVKVFANLLYTRGKMIEQNVSDENLLLARYFIAFASMMDPRNEDIIFEAEIRRIDHGEINWEELTGEG